MGEQVTDRRQTSGIGNVADDGLGVDLLGGHLEIIADRDTALAKAALGADPALVYAGLLG